jgi:hypothetical protein
MIYHVIRVPLRSSLRLHKRRDGTIQCVGNGPEQFGLTFRHHAVGANGLSAGFQQVLFDGRHGQREAAKRGVNPVHATLLPGQQLEIDIARCAKVRRPGFKGPLDFGGVTAADMGKRGQNNNAIRDERFKRVVLDDRPARPAELRSEVVQEDFLQHEFEQLDFLVAFDEPLERF